MFSLKRGYEGAIGTLIEVGKEYPGSIEIVDKITSEGLGPREQELATKELNRLLGPNNARYVADIYGYYLEPRNQ